MSRRELHWSYLGGVPYGPTAELQESLRKEVRHGHGPERLLLLEHDPPVFTVGRNASETDVVAPAEWRRERGVEVHSTKRGGQVTFHGPGQLVAYPIINLDPDRRDVRRYVRDLQRVIVRLLAELGIRGECREGRSFIGVWVGEEKIASIGVHLARWITIHGFALNVSNDLSLFDGIVACGLHGVRMTSVEEKLGEAPPLPELARSAARLCGEVFDRELVEAAAPRLVALEKTG